MDTRNEFQIVSLRAVSVYVLAAMGAIVAGLLLTAPAASATTTDPGGGDGGGGAGTPGGGGDGCTLTGWAFVRNVEQIVRNTDAAGDLCGAHDPDRFDIEQALRLENANGCARFSGAIMGVWYVTDRSGSWAITNRGGSDVSLQTKAYLENVVRTTPNSSLVRGGGAQWQNYPPRAIRELALRSIARESYNTVLCVWRGPTNGLYQCDYLDDWGKYVPARPGTARYDGPAEAQRNCFVRCPSSARGRPNELIPIRYATREQRADFCNPPLQSERREGNWGSILVRMGFNVRLDQYIADAFETIEAQPYSHSTEVVDGGKPVAGQLPFAAQRDTMITSFGEFYANYCQGIGSCASSENDNNGKKFKQFKKDYEEAVARLANQKHATVDLTEANKTALAQGRVVNVNERTTRAYVRGQAIVDRWFTRTCTRSTSYNIDGTVRVRGQEDCTSWRYTPDEQPDRQSVGSILQQISIPEVRTYQILMNHCNSTDFNTVTAGMNATGANGTGKVNTGDSSAYYSAAAVSDVYGSASDLRWGATTDNASSKPEFFDKVCAFNGRKTAVEDRPNAQKPSVTYFRDGEWKDPAFGYFTPISGATVNYEGEAPKATYFTRDPDSTPNEKLSNFRAVGSNGSSTEAFDGTNTEEAPVQKQWSTDGEMDYRGPHVAMIPGSFTSVQAQGLWASEDRQPQVLTLRWRFAPDFVANAPAQTVGYGRVGGDKTWTGRNVTAPVDGMVTGLHGANRSDATPEFKDATMASTGSNSEDTINVPLYRGDAKDNANKWTEEPSDFSPYYYAIKFVRAVGS